VINKYNQCHEVFNWESIKTSKKQSKLLHIDVDESYDDQNEKEIGRCLIKLKKPIE
jgi:hypothetical protein